MQASGLSDGKLPIFVFPTSLIFYADDQASHKQILTLYNPYDFPLKFSVLSTSPRKYAVIDPKGTIRPACCVDIVIRHNAISASNYDVSDKFRIQMHELGSKSVFGKRDIPAVLHGRKPDSSLQGGLQTEAELFEHLPSSSSPASFAQSKEYAFPRSAASSVVAHSGSMSSGTSPGLVVVLAGVLSLIALALPTEGQGDSRLPAYLHLNMHQKLAAAFTLGLVTMAILKS